MAKKDRAKLDLWKRRREANETAYQAALAKMDKREALYRGDDTVTPIVKGGVAKTPHVRNLCAEMIESVVNSSIPQPKVTPRRKEDEAKAKLIEDMLQNELDRLPFEQINDMMERTVPIQGGAAFLVEWDNTERTHTTVGELRVTAVHPKQIVPQDGVYSGIEEMDYVILKLPQTKGYIERRYGVNVEDEAESEPDVKGPAGESTAEDMVTQYVAYYRNENGGIGLYSWVNDTELADIEDYQARRLRRCAVCGAVEPHGDVETVETLADGNRIGASPAVISEEELAEAADKGAEKDLSYGRGRKVCPYCGSDKWEDTEEDFEEIYEPIHRKDGTVIPGAHPVAVLGDRADEDGLLLPDVRYEPTRIPFYKPDIYPVILQKNVSVFGSFLGDSDIDKIEHQQNTTNSISATIIDKLYMSGSYMTLPDAARIQKGPGQMKEIRIGSAADKQLIGVYDMQGNVAQDMAYLAQVYEEARQVIGVTDSFQGRKDPTATSGKAKEFAAAQSAGRMESKRVMKQAAYAALFEAMFKFKLAYADEPRPVVSSGIRGEAVYDTFSRYDFLEQDAAGQWWWNDLFLFSCDDTAPLASNREAMWQETRMNLQTGAFGDPTNISTLILFWTKMEMLHYPGAAETRAYLMEEREKQAMEAQAIQAEMNEMAAQQAAGMNAPAPDPSGAVR